MTGAETTEMKDKGAEIANCLVGSAFGDRTKLGGHTCVQTIAQQGWKSTVGQNESSVVCYNQPVM